MVGLALVGCGVYPPIWLGKVVGCGGGGGGGTLGVVAHGSALELAAPAGWFDSVVTPLHVLRRGIAIGFDGAGAVGGGVAVCASTVAAGSNSHIAKVRMPSVRACATPATGRSRKNVQKAWAMHLVSQMAGDTLYRVEAWPVAIAVLVTLLAAVELAYRAGRRHGPLDQATLVPLGTLQTAVLSLLALLLGFSFALAESRYSTRKRLVVDESNAIGTTYLRAELLPPDTRAEVQRLLARYVDARVAFHEAGTHRARVTATGAEAERVQAQLWRRGVAAAERDPRAVTTGLFLQSLNQVIDLETLRLVALENRVPAAILILLLFVALVAAALIGYGCGAVGSRHFVITTLTIVAFLAVMALIVDFDRPERGLVRVSQQSMVRLRHELGGRP
jgi:hypothetical protein